MFAIVDIAGFQEKVSEGDKLQVPSLSEKEGATVTFDKVLLVAKSDSDVQVGMPYLAGVTVQVKVLGHGRGEKIRVFKMHRRKRYRRTHGHKQGFTEIEVTKIGAGSAKAAASKVEKKEEKKISTKKESK